ncbi:MAG: Uncharacterized protein G01um101418_531 [Parcubacteria group bacterium Gr01-1014_18]|nr:MAG: Uncharacterized protein Greene041636_577 [Parcubacteria group bacterium Greene0416_36]TSC80994.1 MAG: Uncharacterized protein G01um101418_531 [Parcubacteria group bacterium Gr01-1014_18]TSC98881.1 MAG: Uncharacterized protein Greene101420_514 [Parcubacteria group bacterium Greene1014_20]TSD06533.1 MAG: Uncharacterized protein Greene07142_808 [Parcubacteria group bacterium Greene0714_2]
MKLFRLAFLLTVLLDLFSLFAYFNPAFGNIAFFVILFLMVVLSLENLAWGAVLVAAELIMGSFGYWFSLDFDGNRIPLRLGLFLILMSVTVFRVLQKRDGSFLKARAFHWYLPIFGVIVGASLGGLIVWDNSFSEVFFDANGYLFFALIFPFYFVFRNRANFDLLWTVLGGVVLASLIKVLFLFYLFSHDYWIVAPETYKWIRDTRIGEITQMGGDFFRIFLQSQFYHVAGFWILVSGTFSWIMGVPEHPLTRRNFILGMIFFSLFSASLVVSLSRSFWVGMAASGVVLVGIFLVFFRRRWEFIKKSVLLGLGVSALTCVILVGILRFPWPVKTDPASLGILKDRIEWKTEAAVASRWALLPILRDKIAEHWILGRGFGTSVTYISSDPRVIESSPGGTGEYTTSAFEWGYLDIWLKAGLLGLLPFFAVLGWTIHCGWRRVSAIIEKYNRREVIIREDVFALGLFLGVISLAVIHAFTPYLNHPLGIGFLIIASLFLANGDKKIDECKFLC